MKDFAKIAVVAMLLACAPSAFAQGVRLLPDGYPGGNGPRGAPLPGDDCAGGEIYDDGGAENGYSGNPATITNFQGVSQFTPPSYPARYSRVCVGLVSLGGANLDFEIEIHDDDGAGGDPGTLLGTVPVSVTDIPGGLPCTFYPVDISALDIEVGSGSVWIGVRWNPGAFPSRFVCADESAGTPIHPGRLNFNTGDGWQPTETLFPTYRAKLIRAELAAEADLAIEKAGSTNGTQAAWTLTATNNGLSDATDVVVTDTFPACSTFVSDDCGGVGAAPWTWTIGALADQATATCNVVLDVAACPSGPLSNTAEVSAAEVDPDPLNNSDTAEVSLLRADLEVAKAGVTDGSTATWTIQVSNGGPDAASNVVASDTFAACSTFVSDDCGGAGAAPWIWNIGALADQATATCNVVLDVSGCPSGPLSNTAEVSATEVDPDSSNNSDTAEVSLLRADLELAKSGVTDGSTATWTIQVTNGGPDAASNVVASDTFAACSTYVSDDCGGAGAAPWIWNIGALADQATATCNVVLDVTDCPAGSLSNTAEVSAAEADPDPLNNSDTANVSLVRSDLELAKSGVVDGSTATWTLQVTNSGPDAASNVVVSDSLAACSVYVSDDCGGSAGSPWQWNIGALANGASVTCNITVDTAACDSGTLSNTATVSATETDSDPANNSDSADVTLVRSDLAINKTGTLDGTTATWSIEISNTGPDAATGVVITDALAACTTYLSDTCGGADLSTWTLTVGNLASGASLACDIEVDTSGCPAGALSNTASVSGDQFDPMPANDSAAASVSVVDADLSLARTSASSGSLVTWSFVVANAGPADATGVTLTDSIAACASYVSDTCGGADLPPWTADLGNLAAGASTTCDLVINVSACLPGNITNTASVSGNEPDPQPGNNTAPGSISRFPTMVNIPVLGGVGMLALLLGLLIAGVVTARRNA